MKACQQVRSFENWSRQLGLMTRQSKAARQPTRRSAMANLPAIAALLALLLSNAQAQTTTSTTLPVTVAATCPVNQFFDSSAMACSACPSGYFPSADQRSCVTCDTSTGAAFDFDTGYSMFQNWSPATVASTSSCSCTGALATTAVLANVVNFGRHVQRCVVCPATTTVNAATQECVSTTATLPTTPSQDLQSVISVLGLNINAAAAVQAVFPSQTLGPSVPLASLLGPAARACLNGQDRAACNAVANLCVLQLYNGDRAACKIYDGLLNALAGSSVQDRRAAIIPKPSTGPLPWLYYSSNSYSQLTDVGLKVQFSGGSLSEGSVSSLTFVLSTYALNGTWLGYTPWAQQMQLCGAANRESSKWLRFGWPYKNTCQMSLTDILAALPPSREPIFFDLYLQTGPSTLYPVPVKVANYDAYVGNTDNTRGAVRRFFYLDGSLGTVQTTVPVSTDFKVVQYPSSMRMVINVQDTAPNKLLPPALYISYSSRSILSDDGSLLPVSFSAEYVNPQALYNRFWYAWRTMIIVFEVVLGFPLLSWRLFQFLRKRRGDQADQDFLVFVLINVCDVGSLALCCVLGVASLYYLIVIKMQEGVYFLMPPDSDMLNFKVTIILAIVGQTIGLVFRMYTTTKVDIFLLDWEKPRRVLARDGNREVDAPISAWRGLMITNEWRELQTGRITHPAFTWLMMVLILVGAGVENSAAITPDAEDYTNYNNTQQSMILRFGLEVAFLVVLFLGQYIPIRLLWHRYVCDPLMNFVDLLYLANISMVILDDQHCGYYLHGRNHSQHSDATLRDLNIELEKEGEGLVANRGLVTTYTDNPRLNDNQMFLVYMTEDMRKQYDDKMLIQLEQAAAEARMRKGQVTAFIKGWGRPEDAQLGTQDKVAALFRGMIEDVERNHATQIIDPNYHQRVFQLPPEASINNSMFVHDYFRTFASTLLYGHEVRAYVYESIFFLAIDSSIRNVAVSALLTWLTSRILTWFYGMLCKNNLSQKTMVDRHFLV